MDSHQASARYPTRLVFLAAAISCFIATTVLLPVEFMNGILKPLNSIIFTYVPWFGISAGKMGHIAAFFLLTLCTVTIGQRFCISLLKLLAVIMVFSVATEVSQLMVDGRHTKFQDLLFNLTGVCMALAVTYMISIVSVFLRKTHRVR
ncbi:MAG: VanZ family protein [Granulosicoccus sp.]